MLGSKLLSERTELVSRQPSPWTLRLAAPPEQVLTALAAVATDRVWVVEKQGSAVVLSASGREPAPRVVAEVRERNGGSEVEVRMVASRTTRDGLMAVLFACIYLFLGVNIALALGFIGAGCLGLLLWWWLVAARERRADFKAIAHTIDVTLKAFKPGEEGAAYRVSAGPGPASEARRGAPADDGLGIFRSRARRG